MRLQRRRHARSRCHVRQCPPARPCDRGPASDHASGCVSSSQVSAPRSCVHGGRDLAGGDVFSSSGGELVERRIAVEERDAGTGQRTRACGPSVRGDCGCLVARRSRLMGSDRKVWAGTHRTCRDLAGGRTYPTARIRARLSATTRSEEHGRGLFVPRRVASCGEWPAASALTHGDGSCCRNAPPATPLLLVGLRDFNVLAQRPIVNRSWMTFEIGCS
jgi:hypothetical protein